MIKRGGKESSFLLKLVEYAFHASFFLFSPFPSKFHRNATFFLTLCKINSRTRLLESFSIRSRSNNDNRDHSKEESHPRNLERFVSRSVCVFRAHHSGIRMTATLRQSIPLSLSLSTPSNPPSRLRCSGLHPRTAPKHRAIPPRASSVLNATTRGTFLPSLFSLSSQCRFAGWRGEVVERRKRERKLDEETAGGKKKRKGQSKKCRRRRKAKEARRATCSLSVYRADRNAENDPSNRAVITHRTQPFLLFSLLSFSPTSKPRLGIAVWCFRFKRPPSCPRSSTHGTSSSLVRE